MFAANCSLDLLWEHDALDPDEKKYHDRADEVESLLLGGLPSEEFLDELKEHPFADIVGLLVEEVLKLEAGLQLPEEVVPVQFRFQVHIQVGDIRVIHYWLFESVNCEFSAFNN